MILTAPYNSVNRSYIHISTLSRFRMSAIWWAPYLAVKNFSRFFSSVPLPPPKFTCRFGVAGVCLWFELDVLDEDIFDDLEDDCNLDVAEIDEDDDNDEFADEFPESVDPTPDDAYEDVFGPHTADATSILAEGC